MLTRLDANLLGQRKENSFTYAACIHQQILYVFVFHLSRVLLKVTLGMY